MFYEGPARDYKFEVADIGGFPWSVGTILTTDPQRTADVLVQAFASILGKLPMTVTVLPEGADPAITPPSGWAHLDSPNTNKHPGHHAPQA